MTKSLRTLPHDVDAEKALIGSLLIDPTTLPEVSGIVDAKAFCLPAAGSAFQAIQQLSNSGTPVDAVTILDTLQQMGAADESTADWLAEAANSTPHAGHARHYAEVIADRRDRRHWALLLAQAGEGARDLTRPLPDLLSAIRGELLGLGESKPEATTAKPTKLEAWRTFPVEVLPEPILGFVVASAAAMRCDPALVALPMLAALASAIGSSRSLLAKPGWFAPSILWTAVVAESGSMKSPAIKAALQFLRAIESRAHREHESAEAEHLSATERFKAEHAKWKQQPPGSETEEPTPPVPPVARRYLAADATVEALAPILRENPRGVLLQRDELAGWFGSFNQYSSGKGADEAKWLSAYNGEEMLVDRRTGFPRTIRVPHALVSVTGGIQPGVLSRQMGKEHRESGLLARFLLCCPPREPKLWTDAAVDDATHIAVRDVFDGLIALEPAANPEGEPVPMTVRLSGPARDLFKAFYNAHNLETAELSGDLAAAWSKLEETPARLALVLHCVRFVSGDNVEPLVCDADTMAAALRLTDWFKHEVRRVYAILAGESPAVSNRRKLVDWIAKRGGRVRVSDVYTNYRPLKDSGAAEKSLAELVGAGLGEWQEQPAGSRGGRPTRVFVLSVSEELSESGGFLGFSDSDNADETPDDGWGAN